LFEDLYSTGNDNVKTGCFIALQKYELSFPESLVCHDHGKSLEVFFGQIPKKGNSSDMIDKFHSESFIFF
jgi:hypothetical protein